MQETGQQRALQWPWGEMSLEEAAITLTTEAFRTLPTSLGPKRPPIPPLGLEVNLLLKLWPPSSHRIARENTGCHVRSEFQINQRFCFYSRYVPNKYCLSHSHTKNYPVFIGKSNTIGCPGFCFLFAKSGNPNPLASSLINSLLAVLS